MPVIAYMFTCKRVMSLRGKSLPVLEAWCHIRQLRLMLAVSSHPDPRIQGSKPIERLIEAHEGWLSISRAAFPNLIDSPLALTGDHDFIYS